MESKAVAYSILELAVISQGVSVGETLRRSTELAKLAEACGYRRIWFAEHHNAAHIGSSATALLIGHAAEHTMSIRVGSGGIMLPNHSPLIIAEQFATLAHLYPGRIDLGLGRAPGTDPQTAQEIRADFFRAAHAFPEELAKLRRYFSVENRHSPVRVAMAEGVEMPIYILGSSTDSAHLAARLGLPYAFASHFATTHLHEALRIYREEFQPSEFLQEPYAMAGVNVIVADTDEAAERLFTSVIRMFLGILTGDREPLHPPTVLTEDLKEILSHPTVQQMLRYSFVGGPERVREQTLQFLGKTAVNELITVTSTYNFQDRMKSVQLFATVMEEINGSRGTGKNPEKAG